MGLPKEHIVNNICISRFWNLLHSLFFSDPIDCNQSRFQSIEGLQITPPIARLEEPSINPIDRAAEVEMRCNFAKSLDWLFINAISLSSEQ